MTELKIEPIFRDLLPPLAPEQLAMLEADILHRGIVDKLRVWRRENVLVDGHHRYAIATKHGLPFDVEYMDFGDRTEVLLWMLKHQSARRSLSKRQRVRIAFEALVTASNADGVPLEPNPQQVAALSAVDRNTVDDHIFLMLNNPDMARALEQGEKLTKGKKNKAVEADIVAPSGDDYGFDPVGQKIPSEKVARSLIGCKADMELLTRDATRFFARLRAHAGGPFAGYITPDEVTNLESRVAKLLQGETPYCVCVTCKGTGVGEDAKCKDCGSCGWWPKERFNRLAPRGFKVRLFQQKKEERERVPNV